MPGTNESNVITKRRHICTPIWFQFWASSLFVSARFDVSSTFSLLTVNNFSERLGSPGIAAHNSIWCFNALPLERFRKRVSLDRSSFDSCHLPVQWKEDKWLFLFTLYIYSIFKIHLQMSKSENQGFIQLIATTNFVDDVFTRMCKYEGGPITKIWKK